MAHYTTSRPDLLDDETWSDDELDYLDNLAAKQDLSHGKHIQSVDIQKSKGEKSKDKIFSGVARILTAEEKQKEREGIALESKNNTDGTFDYPLPHVPDHVYEILGEKVVHLLWEQFLLHDSDDSELMLTEHIPAVEEAMKKLGHNLPFDQLNIDEDGNEYTDFAFVIDKLAVRRNKAGVVKPIVVLKAQLPPCCATGACFVHSRNEKKVQEEGDDRPDFRLDVIYRRWVLEKRGIVRVKDTSAILVDADIEHDTEILPEDYWILHGDELLLNYEKLADVVDQIRLDKDDDVDQLDLYRLPKWLMNEFIPQEVAMFRHHFMVRSCMHTYAQLL